MEQSDGSRPSRRQFLGAIGTGIVAGIAGCAVTGTDSPLQGNFEIDGSNTVLPHAVAVAEEFSWQHGNVSNPVSGSGTGAGFQRFCLNETEFQNASRQIEESERQQCADNNVDWLEIAALRDGIAIYKHPDNPVDRLTQDQLRRIWEQDSDIQRWSDLDPDWPDEEIALYGRDSASGTFDYFTREITGAVGNIRTDYSGNPDTNTIVRGVSGNQYAIGFGGAGYYYENEDDLGLIAVENDEGEFILPTAETIRTGEYSPLSRDMYLYIRTDALERLAVAAFALFYFVDADEEAIGRLDNPPEDDQPLMWTQWAALRVGFYSLDRERLIDQLQTLREQIPESTLDDLRELAADGYYTLPEGIEQ